MGKFFACEAQFDENKMNNKNMETKNDKMIIAIDSLHSLYLYL